MTRLTYREVLVEGLGVALCAALQVFWRKTSVLGNSRQHSGTNFFPVMEGERDVRPSGPGKRSVRSSLPLDGPAQLQQC